MFGDDAYPDLWTKAAALMQSLVTTHPLVDGNKRLGWLATAVFLELSGIATQHATNDDVYEFVMAVAAGALSINDMNEALHRLLDGSQ